MSALAKYYLNKDRIIYGYDILRSDICISLEKQGSKITYCQKNLDFILDNNLFKDQESCLVVFTPAIKNDNIKQHKEDKSPVTSSSKEKSLKDNSNKNWQTNKDWEQNIIIHYILYIRIAKIITSEKIIENAEW